MIRPTRRAASNRPRRGSGPYQRMGIIPRMRPRTPAPALIGAGRGRDADALTRVVAGLRRALGVGLFATSYQSI